MNRDEVLAKLREHEADLRLRGVLHIGPCGSTVRNEAGPDSDVDLLTDFDKTLGLTLIDLVGLEQQLEELLGAEVDLLDRDTLPDRIRQRMEAEAVLAF